MSAALFFASLLLGTAPVAAQSPSRFVVAESTTIKPLNTTPMHLPTDVAVDRAGRVYIADGANDRILIVQPDGTLIAEVREADGLPLRRPVGVHLDAEDRLWIADTGNARALLRGADGATLRTLVPPTDPNAPPADITDVITSNDAVWLIDNDGHRLFVWRGTQGAPTIVGAQGEAAGQFHYPFLAAATDDGDILVTDVINGRIARVTAAGTPATPIATHGVSTGRLYRPSGIVVDAQSRVWVADSVMGIIQIFSASGAVLGVLSSPDGSPARWDAPLGLAFDHDGWLYIVESRPGQVRRVRIAEDATVATPEPPRVTQDQPRSCTVCHMEWMREFTTGTALIPAPDNPTNNPAVSRERTCLSCHDGSVADSRRSVWLEHGHRMGVKPPADMTIPGDLPLVEGAVACRTCHSAHTRAGSGNLLKDAVFLRVKNEPGELCVRCHENQVGAPDAGMHPTSGLLAAHEAALRSLGAHPAHDPTATACLTCHAAHGSGSAALLVSSRDTSRLCLTCHADMGTPDFAHAHPIHAKLTPAMAAHAPDGIAVDHASGTLGCVSCHKLHHGHEGRLLLAAPIKEDALCLTCHADAASVHATAHDLARTAPEERNALGRTVEQSGACSACHAVHSPARKPMIGPGDPSGRCLTCHSAGACAAGALSPPLGHPLLVNPASLEALRQSVPRVGTTGQLECADCHNPHGGAGRMGERSLMLRASSDATAQELCAHCHEQTQRLDHSLHRNVASAMGSASATNCTPCHSVHDRTPHDGMASVWAMPLGDAAHGASEAQCTGCHATAGPAKAVWYDPHLALPMISPVAESATGFMPLVDAAGRPGMIGKIACVTCHASHGREDSGGFDATAALAGSTDALRLLKPMLRPYVTPNLCSSCHGFDGLQRFLYFHAEDSSRRSPVPVDGQ